MLRTFVFTAGAVLMSLEILGSRVLAPQYGNSVIVWGSLIGVFLAALSLGYWAGGRLADRLPRPTIIATLVAAAGAYAMIIPTLAPIVFQIASDSVRVGSLTSATALFFIPCLFLGAVSPYAIRLEEARVERIGRSAGGLYAISTLGSIVGTIATAFWLLPLAGVPTLIRGFGGLLILAAAALFVWSMPEVHFARVATVAGGGLCIVIATALAIIELSPADASHTDTKEKVLFERDSFYHHIRVTENGDLRELHFDNSGQSGVYKSQPLVSAYPYTEFLGLGRVFVSDPSDVLIIGLGGGVVAHQYLVAYPHVRVDCAEIDPAVVEVAQRFFYFPASHPRLRVSAEDGRRFLNRIDRHYDIIIVDAFYKDSVPFHLVTREFYSLVRQKLTPRGVMVLNMIGTVRGPRSALFTSVYQTVGTAFRERYVFARWLNFPNLDNKVRNCIIVAGQLTKMSEIQLDDAFLAARARGVSDAILRHRGDCLSREPDNYLARTFTDAYAPVDDLINIMQQ